jgi:hypothetical protein
MTSLGSRDQEADRAHHTWHIIDLVCSLPAIADTMSIEPSDMHQRLDAVSRHLPAFGLAI